MDLEVDFYRGCLIVGAISGAAWGVHVGGLGGLILGIVVGGFSGKIAAWAILLSRGWSSIVGMSGLIGILVLFFLYLIDALWGVGRI
jgi:hypothetical protein